ncbi:MAG: hypothetical protein KGO81_09075 [Bacteroidota bacterium]|nr:hypothetical protein [Bacteroidota bacterium]
MNALKYYFSSLLLLLVVAGCKKESFTDTSFASTAAQPAKLTMMFEITQDNTGLVTITPNGEGIVAYDIYYGDNTSTPVHVVAGKSTKHIYAEGVYNVKAIGYNINGQSVQATQQLTVSFRPPANLKVNVNISNLTVNVSASALYETFFKVYFGDSTTVNPEPYTSFLEGQTVTHSYAQSGTYIVRVIALSGGAATTQYLDTIKVAKQIDLPVTFEDPNVDYTVSDFGGNSSSLVLDPTNASNHVMKSVKTAGAQVWAGTTVGTGLGFATPIPLTAAAKKMSVRVYSPAAGLDVKLKVEDHNNGTHSVETDVLTTVANQWETLTFDLGNPAAGTQAWNASYTYDKLSLFFDFGNPGIGSVFYFDDIKMLPPSLAQISLPVNFENPTVDYTVTDFGNNSTVDAVDPTNSANHVKKTTKTSGAQTWAGTTIGTALGFASKIPITAAATKMSVKVYSPAAGIDIKLKIEDHTNGANSVETDVKTTVANQWETLVFDFNNPASGTPALNTSFNYDKASIFFDFGNAGTGSVFYWDEIHFLSQINLPLNFNNPDMDPTVNDYGGNASTLVTDPDPSHSTGLVMQSVKTSGAQVWAGTNVSSLNAAQTANNGFASNIVLGSSMKMSLDVYAPAAGLDIKLKLGNVNSSLPTVETDVLTTKSGWQTLTFDFTQPAAGTPAWSASNTYNLASVFFDFGNPGSGKTFYWNNLIIQ